jgi:uncharacterized membrane protein YccF (DUF307 family)
MWLVMGGFVLMPALMVVIVMVVLILAGLTHGRESLALCSKALIANGSQRRALCRSK